MADNLLFRGSSVSQQYYFTETASSTIVQRDRITVVPTVDYPVSYNLLFPDERFQFSFDESTSVSTLVNLSSAIAFTYNASAYGSVLIGSNVNTATGFTHGALAYGNALITVGTSTVTGFTNSVFSYGTATIGVSLSAATGLTYGALAYGNSLTVVNLNAATGLTPNVIAYGNSVASVDINAATGITYQTLAYGNSIASVGVTVATGLTYGVTTYGNAAVISNTSIATGLTPNVIAYGNSIASVVANLATGLTYSPTINLDSSTIVSVGAVAITGFTHTPVVSISVYINFCNYNSAIPYNSSEIYNCFNGSTASIYTNPVTVRKFSEASLSTAILSTYTPTLNIDSSVIVAVNSVGATGFTYRPRFGTVGLGPDYTGTSEILDSYPSLRKGILNSNSNPVTVIAGQVGLPNGSILIHLGNGQWIIRK